MSGGSGTGTRAREERDSSDGRRARGERTRRRILDQALDDASLHGLAALSFGELAKEVGVSKAGVQGLFGSKDELLLAVVDHHRLRFVEAVIEPASAAAPGLPRLRAILDRWIAYAEEPFLAGGCFRGANLAAMDSESGPLHDRFFADQDAWIETIRRQLGIAVEKGEIPATVDVDRTTFLLDSALGSTNIALRVGDPMAVERLRGVVDELLS